MDNSETEEKAKGIKKQQSIKLKLTKFSGTSKRAIHEEMAEEVKRHLSAIPKAASRTYGDE